jgi:hypothetical protein
VAGAGRPRPPTRQCRRVGVRGATGAGLGRRRGRRPRGGGATVAAMPRRTTLPALPPPAPPQVRSTPQSQVMYTPRAH